jgi:hypothetical protein
VPPATAVTATRAHHYDLSFLNEILGEFLGFDRRNLIVR